MTLNGWIQIVDLLRDRRRAGEAARLVHDPRVQRRPHVPVAGLTAGRDRTLSPRRSRRDPRAELAWLHGRHAAVSCRRLPHPLRAAPLARLSAIQPAGHGGCARISQLQHCHQLHHQHQLAELWRREHAVISRADARTDASELSLGGNRHRAGGGADPRLRPRLGEDRRQFLGRYHPLHALHPHSHLRTFCPFLSLAGDAADARTPMSTRRRWKAPSRPSP